MSRNYFIPYFDQSRNHPTIPTVRLGIRGEDDDHFIAVVSTERPSIIIPADLVRTLGPRIISGPPPGLTDQFEMIEGKRTKMKWVEITVWIFDEMDRRIEWETVAAVSQTVKRCYLGNVRALNYLQPRFRKQGIEVELTSDFPGEVTPSRQ